MCWHGITRMEPRAACERPALEGSFPPLHAKGTCLMIRRSNAGDICKHFRSVSRVSPQRGAQIQTSKSISIENLRLQGAFGRVAIARFPRSFLSNIWVRALFLLMRRGPRPIWTSVTCGTEWPCLSRDTQKVAARGQPATHQYDLTLKFV